MSEQRLPPQTAIPVTPAKNESLRPPPSKANLANVGVTSFRPAVEHEQISLVSEGETRSGKIQAFGVAGQSSHQTQWKRKTNVNGTGATRVRSFHCRLSDEGLAYLDEKVSQWLDEHPDYEVKFASTTIGVFETKSKDLSLIVNIWY